jgi:hypothetical protein
MSTALMFKKNKIDAPSSIIQTVRGALKTALDKGKFHPRTSHQAPEVE